MTNQVLTGLRFDNLRPRMQRTADRKSAKLSRHLMDGRMDGWMDGFF